MSKSSHEQEDFSRGQRRAPVGERGRQRRDLILDTAAELLVEQGADAVTTNALAARAGIAVGSVYQYFSNKESVLTALGERYLASLGANTVTALQQDLSGLTMREMVDRVMGPMIAFERSHPAFGHLTDNDEHIDSRILLTIRDLFARIRPETDEALAWQTAHVTKAMYKGMSYLIAHESRLNATGTSLDSVLDSMKSAMAGYLARVLGESAKE